MEQMFEIFFFFWKYVQNWENVRNFGHKKPYLKKKSKIQKSVPWIFRYNIEVNQDQISAS